MRESRDQSKCVENIFGSKARAPESEDNEVGSLVGSGEEEDEEDEEGPEGEGDRGVRRIPRIT